MCHPGRPRPQGDSQAESSLGLGGLPEREVERVAFALGPLDPLPLVHLVDIPMA